MAAIDTIEVLSNLQFTHENTADIYTVHADGQAGESVAMIPVSIPPDYKGVKVIINNNYGATGSTVYGRVKATAVTALNAGGITKNDNIQVMEWTSIALAAIQDCGELDVSTYLQTQLHIDVAIVGTTAHLGTEIIVQGRKETTVNEWDIIARFVVLAGLTAFKSDVKSTAASGQKIIPVDNPTAGNLNHVGKYIFIVDATIANCEICYQTACGADS